MCGCEPRRLRRRAPLHCCLLLVSWTFAFVPAGSPQPLAATDQCKTKRHCWNDPRLSLQLRGGWDRNPGYSGPGDRYPRFHGQASRVPRGPPFGSSQEGSRPPRRDPRFSVAVKGIEGSAQEQNLIDLFDNVGLVTNVKLFPSNPRYPTRLAFVNFGDVESLDAAVKLDNTVPDWNQGRPLRIEVQYRSEVDHSTPSAAFEQQIRSSASHATPAAPVAHSKPASIGPWVPVMSRSRGTYYWFNTLTNQTSWIPPMHPERAPARPEPKERKLAKQVKKAPVQQEEEEEEAEDDGPEYCDSEGYFNEQDRAELEQKPMVEREVILAERLERREAEREQRRVLRRSRAPRRDVVPPKTQAKRGVAQKKTAPKAKPQPAKLGVGAWVKLKRKGAEDAEEGRGGLLVQKREEGGTAVFRIVWEDGAADEWLRLGEWEVEQAADTAGAAPKRKGRPAKKRKAGAAPAARGRKRGRKAAGKKRNGGNDDDDDDDKEEEAMVTSREETVRDTGRQRREAQQTLGDNKMSATDPSRRASSSSVSLTSSSRDTDASFPSLGAAPRPVRV